LLLNVYRIQDVAEKLDDSIQMIPKALPEVATVQELFSRTSSRSATQGFRGQANAARVSKGSFVDNWQGLTVKRPQRDDTQHVTVTFVLYNTIAGGVPDEKDIIAAVDDMEQLYKAGGAANARRPVPPSAQLNSR
jgi:hypothetical protein